MFETKRLTVRRMGEGDAGFMLDLLNDPGWIANIGDRGVRTIEQAQAYVVERMATPYALQGFGYFPATLKTDGQTIGTVSLVRRPGLDDLDLGFAFFAANVGRGYGEEASRGLIDWAVRQHKIDRLLAVTVPDNTASVRLLTKLRFVERPRVTLPGHAEESRLFEWNAGNGSQTAAISF